MKHIFHLFVAAAGALALAACDTGTAESAGESGCGSLRLDIATVTAVDAQTRATVELPAAVIPNGNHFSLCITGSYTDDLGATQIYDREWPQFGDYDSPLMPQGNYTATANYGDMEQEGEKAAAFGGTTDFRIMARRTITASVATPLRNSALKVAFGEWFTTYYANPVITIRTESNHTFSFTPAASHLIFVKPGTRLYLSGRAEKAQTGTEVEFAETEIGTTAPCTLHTVTLTASEAGSGRPVIRFDETFTETEEKIIELNPEV